LKKEGAGLKPAPTALGGKMWVGSAHHRKAGNARPKKIVRAVSAPPLRAFGPINSWRARPTIKKTGRARLAFGLTVPGWFANHLTSNQFDDDNKAPPSHRLITIIGYLNFLIIIKNLLNYNIFYLTSRD
jgi:hypothetical protein